MLPLLRILVSVNKSYLGHTHNMLINNWYLYTVRSRVCWTGSGGYQFLTIRLQLPGSSKSSLNCTVWFEQERVQRIRSLKGEDKLSQWFFFVSIMILNCWILNLNFVFFSQNIIILFLLNLINLDINNLFIFSI